jgi:cytochrome c553
MTSLTVLAILFSWTRVADAADGPPDVVEFNRDVRPILSDKCFACHGPDKNARKSELRLDLESGAFAELDDGHAIVPGQPAQSEVYQRISHESPRRRMPPAKFGKTLSSYEIAVVRRWIEQGAKWEEHWSQLVPRRRAVPTLKDASRVRNPIDAFLLARLEREGIALAAEADRRTLIRRLSFDLTGLPPEPEAVDDFVDDEDPRAYEKLVDRLIESPHYGERMAMPWLDLVRFADTNGIHGDNHREIAPFRDWVIRAFNENMPFDRFTIEQLAGDFLPNVTIQTRIASGYNRLLMTTREGGAQAKEYRAKYAADRVRNASTVWMAATLGCAECHDHKFDKYTQRDFYSFAAFFADIQETAVGAQAPTLLPSPEEQELLKKLNAEIAALKKTLSQQTSELEAAWDEWEASAKASGTKLPKKIAAIVAIEKPKRSNKQKAALIKYHSSFAKILEPTRKRSSEAEKQRKAIEAKAPRTLVSTRGKPRMMRVLPRGNWLDDSGEEVTPATPAFMRALDLGEARGTRLDLAKWLVAPENPVVSRVFVNRLWRTFFGRGLVKTLDDFGSQGSWPTHLDLLDWLALEFVDKRWDVKAMTRLIVTSSAYRQSSIASSQERARDPFNKLVARQGRFRLDAEMVRDGALLASGLLSRTMGGESVKPYQPSGYWAHLNFPRRNYKNDSGANLYRRGIYTYWCRTFLHPSLLAFDAPTREECTVERGQSNTPQQALVLLNDPTYVESARALATWTLTDVEGGTPQRLRHVFRRVLSRSASVDETRILTSLLDKHLAEYAKDPKAAEELLGVGDLPNAKGLSHTELAAWMSVCRVVLNLHETITRF